MMVRRLKDEERALWRSAVRDVRPITPGSAPAPAAAVATPRRTPAPRPGDVNRRILTRLRRGELPVEARLDLHGLTQDTAYRALVSFIADCAADGARLVLVITGKGRSGAGVLRAAAPQWLAESPSRARILAVTPAAPKHGGSGALYVLLRRSRGRSCP